MELVNANLEHCLPKQHRAFGQAELMVETAGSPAGASDNRTSSGSSHVRYDLDENHEFLINGGTGARQRR
ncbi:hypothetical protein ACFQ8O_29710 [Streptomyces coelicoflavus]|uniref:hypothetical protein n=1 Tax=Streptomyces coelicoflavus TaxID=285562 RepID=UPI00368888CB